jgi:pilus assembly protein CpaB
MNKKLAALLMAGLLTVVGVGAVVKYAQGAEDRAFDNAALVSVLVVTQPVPAGSPAERLVGSVETKQVPKTVLAEGAVTDLASLGAEVTNAALVPGEQVLAARFGEVVKKVDTSELPAGLQQMDLILNAPRVPEGTKAGDTVGVVASYASTDGGPGVTRMILNQVRVMSLKQNAVGEAGSEATAEGIKITFALTTNQAERVTNAAEFGKVWLTSQNTKTDVGGSKKVDAKAVLK